MVMQRLAEEHPAATCSVSGQALGGAPASDHSYKCPDSHFDQWLFGATVGCH